MTKRRFERYLYRPSLGRRRQGASDREIARSGILGRRKIAKVRAVAAACGWLALDSPVPDEAVLSAQFARHEAVPASGISTLAPWREQIRQWHGQGIPGTTIHAALVRNHGYPGSYSSGYRFLHQLELEAVPEVPLRLDFKPGEAAHMDCGAGPVLTQALTGEPFNTWVFGMPLCWSRHQYAELVRDQSSATWLACHRHAFEWFNGVPGRLIIDTPKCAIPRACFQD
ncbi:MAG TPA: IS21 family transposase, partial [Candidatus Competibacteraceae bacterium]|nr:IS21 family transposase [Candidatus Competibacteraceae bacterium]